MPFIHNFIFRNGEKYSPDLEFNSKDPSLDRWVSQSGREILTQKYTRKVVFT